jgi:hypothetical protein
MNICQPFPLVTKEAQGKLLPWPSKLSRENRSGGTEGGVGLHASKKIEMEWSLTNGVNFNR